MTLVPTDSHARRNSATLPDNSDGGLDEQVAMVFECMDVSENTRRQYRREVRPFLKFVDARDGHLSPTTLLEWKRCLAARADIAAATKRKYLNVARVLLRELHRWGILPDFTKGVKSFQVTRVHKRTPITDEELERIWQYLNSEADLRTRAIIGLLYYQGLRRIE
jgi:site-specific recombinase XerD